MAANQIDALVIFGATGDLAKLETFPALVGLVKRGVLNVPVIGVAKSGWGLEQFRDYATASLKLNGMDPADSGGGQDARACCATWTGTSATTPPTRPCPMRSAPASTCCSTWKCRRSLFGRIAQGIAGAGRARGARVMVEKPFGTDLASSRAAQRHHARALRGRGDLPGRRLAGLRPGGERPVRPVRQLGDRAAAQPHLRGQHPDHDGGGSSTSPTAAGSTTGPGRSGTCCRTTCSRCSPPCWPNRRAGRGLDAWRGRQVTGWCDALQPADPGAHGARAVRRLPARSTASTPSSTVETYVAVRLSADTWRWAGVPILIRAGKCLPVTATEIAITFKQPTHDVFGIEPVAGGEPTSASGSGQRRGSTSPCPEERCPRGLAWSRCRRTFRSRGSQELTFVPMTGSSARRSTGTLAAAPARTPWKPCGRSSTPFSETPPQCIPTPRAAGVPRRRTGS